MRTKRCKVIWGRDHLADLWLLDDGRWQLQPTETHIPMNLLQYVRLFDPYVGPTVPPLVRDWMIFTGVQLDPRDPISTLIDVTTGATSGLRFEREGR